MREEERKKSWGVNGGESDEREGDKNKKEKKREEREGERRRIPEYQTIR